MSFVKKARIKKGLTERHRKKHQKKLHGAMPWARPMDERLTAIDRRIAEVRDVRRLTRDEADELKRIYRSMHVGPYRDRALAHFALGVLTNLLTEHTPMRSEHIATIVDLPVDVIERCATSARNHSGREGQFLVWFNNFFGSQKNDTYNDEYALRIIFYGSDSDAGPDKAAVMASSFMAVRDRVSRMIDEWGHAEDPMEQAHRYDELIKIKDWISRAVPSDEAFGDITYITYGACCGCGTEPRSEVGHPVHETHAFLRYPLCEKCSENNVPADYERVARMWYYIATEQEKLVRRLQMEVGL